VVDVAASIETDEELMSDLDGPRRNAATLAVLAAADRVIAVGAADPIGLARFLRIYPEALEHITTDRVEVVINRVRRAVAGVGDAHILRTLERFGGIRDAHLVPDDRDALDAALIAGRPLAEIAPRSPARLAVRALAERLDPTLAGRRRRSPRSKRLPLSRVDPQ
jgi:Flp pilus assembly CpaE family ATPase